ncbi:carbohydrate ABC transporter permease [Modestobacter sp. VKM Ac-2977]|uniref:carbohydrate ABC transporter permease n=1 Tax=Modestobacter sp. VKM Ac-2977 TaxID=3004131 RepID=UPI0022AACC1D|nr:carbohydrate ABC transporter permease [Modestobacter sp. VKM Ac-2977]MCZ2822651.1 carbohydrate ABC transporter permease [Modestobacter sp. VKM Ac-2977]
MSATVHRRTHRRRAQGRAGRAGAYLLLTVLTVVFVAPIAYMVIGSFKPAGEVIDGLSGFLPRDLSLGNYTGMLDRFDSPATGRFSDFYLTSLIVAGVVVLGGLVVNSMAAYALARLRWRGRDAVLMIVVLLVILPFEAIAVPLFYLLNDHRNTYYVQFLPFVASAFSIYLFYSFFAGLPKEMEEAARVDGAGPWRTFFLIIVPNSKPVFATVTILSFLTAWGSFLWPVMMVDQPQRRPLPLEIAVFQGQPPYDWGQIFAFGVLMVLPVLLVFLLFQRWFVQSVASSGLKG